MVGLSINLYPPVVDTYSPTFVIQPNNKKTKCRIYFSFSAYNSIENVKNIQISLRNQKTNNSVFDKAKYPSGLKIINNTDFCFDKNQYYIEIPSTDILGGFHNNQYYKIQLRFSAVEYQPKDINNPGLGMEDWLNNNIEYFSEWSTISLIRGISKPSLDLLYFTNTDNTFMVLAQNTLSIVGKLQFQDQNEQDTLKQYKIQVYDIAGQLVAESPDIYTNNYNHVNELNYTIKKELQNGNQYIVKIIVTTKNLYTFTQQYKFAIMTTLLDKINASLTATPDIENGTFLINLKQYGNVLTTGQIVFRRTSSRSNFTVWEDLHTVHFIDEQLNYSWVDNTIESGIWYKYSVQKVDRSGNRGVSTEIEKPVMITFEDAFLCADGKQLRIKYNPQISAYKTILSESKTETLGSKYPFIKRNGAMEYRQFPISGLITFHMDYNNDFISKKQLLGNDEILTLYNKYNELARIDNYNDYVTEREFRETVIKFLNADNVKLMRTLTEGNILIKLMDVNLTPDQKLGRMVYTFSATAHEIGTYTIENLIKYHINDKALKNENLDSVTIERNSIGKGYSKDISKTSQYTNTFTKNKEILNNYIVKQYKYLESDSYFIKLNNIDYLNVTFNMPPYRIYRSYQDNKLYPVTDEENKNDVLLTGYLITVNGENIYVNSDGLYTLYNMPITSLSFPIDTNATLDYQVNLSKIEDIHKTSAVSYFYNTVGQIWRVFEYNKSIFKFFALKYNYKNETMEQKVISVNGLKIEADPGTVCYIKDATSDSFKTFIINDTEFLSLCDDHTIIEDFVFGGVHLDKCSDFTQIKPRDNIPNNQYALINIEKSYSTIEEIKNPIANGIYNIAEQYYIYYKEQWCIFDLQKEIVHYHVNAIVDYWCVISKGVY